MTRAFWTPDEDARLRTGFDSTPLAELCRELGRSPRAIGARCAALGLGGAAEPWGTLAYALHPPPTEAPAC